MGLSPQSITIKFAAMRFLVQWYHKEKRLYARIRQPRPELEDIREALRHFQIARNFAKVKDGDRVRAIRSALLKCRHRGSLSPVENVERLAEAFKQADFQRNISAASKLLWLSARAPYKIYDERAWNALKSLNAKPGKKGDYAEYCKSWRGEFRAHREQIESAISKLTALQSFLPAPQPTSRRIGALVNNQWFKERVFDIYLWERGDQPNMSIDADA